VQASAAVAKPDPRAGQAPSKPRIRDRVAVGVFLLAFLIPMLLRSTVLAGPLPYSPALLTKLHNIACLFTHKPNGWSSYFVQLQSPETLAWQTIDQAELFPLEPFGRRTRMHRLLVAWQAKPSARTEDMARWIVARWTELHPDRPTPLGLRFTRAWMHPSRDAPPQHGWEHPDWFEVPPKQRRIIVSYTIDQLFPEGS
jgi:hypothetical protein